MTKVTQIDWSKLMPEQPVKSGRKPNPALFKKKRKKLKPIDKSLFREDYEHRKHLRDITREC